MDKMLGYGTDRCQCTACGEYFNSTYAFDKHRYGSHTEGRKCLTSDEMEGKGWEKNKTGHWVTQKRPLGGAVTPN